MNMKYIPKELKETADVSAGEGSQWVELGKLLLYLVAFILFLYLSVGLIVDAIVANISAEKESELFIAWGLKAELEARYGCETHEKDDILLVILDSLITHPDVPPLKFNLLTIVDKTPNAFAVPGGTIAVTTGLLDTLDTDLAFAFVLGHELGHFHNRDHLRGLGRQIGIGIIYALIFGSSTGNQVIVENTLLFLSRNYSRRQEEAADRFGVTLVHDLYGQTDGVTRLFEILDEKTTLPGWAYMFSTHPRLEDRIRKLKEYAYSLDQIEKPQAD